MKEQFDLYTNHDTGMLLLPEEKRRVLHQAVVDRNIIFLKDIEK